MIIKTRPFWSVVYVVGCGLCILGAALMWIEVMAIGSALVGAGYAGYDLTSPWESSVTPLTIHALFAGVWMGASHFVACLVIDTRYERTFFAYSDFGYLLEAQYLATLTTVVPLFASRIVERRVSRPGRARPVLPLLGSEFSDTPFLAIIVGLVATDVVGIVLATSLTSTPILGPLLRVGAIGAIFMLAWHWYGPDPSLPGWTKYLVVVLIVSKVSLAFLYASMRAEIVYPLYAFYLAVLLRRALKGWMIVAALIFLIPFSYVYVIIGGIKGQGIVGSERVNLVLGERPKSGSLDESENPLIDAAMSLTARSCNFGQLSQVVRIADEEGLYYGETLSYLFYVFIPRVVWPEKPEIAPGQWFARKLGKGREAGEKGFSNSINMTVAGEFYLNFGWLAAVAGLFLYGAMLRVAWDKASIFHVRNNATGLALAFFLLMQGSYASSAAALPQILISYGSLLIAQSALDKLAKKRLHAGSSVPQYPAIQPQIPRPLGSIGESRNGDSTL